jgi:hypothetical protein
MAAPLGFKTFATGDVLTAADTNGYLMQGLWVFANATARDAAVTSPQEGNACYLKDTDNIMVYSGSAWVTKSGSGSNGSSVNLLLNSNFAINQRNYLSAANLASGAYGFDRWKSNFTNTTLTFTANTQGQELTINSGGGIEQIIERGLVPAGTYTLSWTGTATARVYNTGATPPSYAASPVTFTADGLANVEVEFTASGGTRTVSYVQFNAGTNTTWALATPTLQSELAACQRYFQLYVSGNSFPVAMGTYFAGGDLRMAMNYPVTMRTAPALVVATGTNYYISIYNTTTDAFDSLRIYNASTNMMSVIADGASVSGTAGNGALINTNNASASIAFNSEL